MSSVQVKVYRGGFPPAVTPLAILRNSNDEHIRTPQTIEGAVRRVNRVRMHESLAKRLDHGAPVRCTMPTGSMKSVCGPYAACSLEICYHPVRFGEFQFLFNWSLVLIAVRGAFWRQMRLY